MKEPKGNENKRRKEALKICTAAIEKNIAFKERTGESFISYARAFWDFNGKRIRLKNASGKKNGPLAISKDYAMTMLAYFNNYIVPALKRQDIQIQEVNKKTIDEVWGKYILEDKLAHGTISKIRQAMVSPLKQAYKNGEIPNDPTKNLTAIDVTAEKERGVMTLLELKSALKYLSTNRNVHAYLATSLSAATGMRLGEVIALRVSEIERINNRDSLITINSSFSKRSGYKEPKGKKGRQVAIPNQMADALITMAQHNTFGNDLIFWSYSSAKNPISASYISKGFNEAMAFAIEEEQGYLGEIVEIIDKNNKVKTISKGEALRRERNIVFHSLRHFCVSNLRGRVDDTMMRLAIGHESEQMSDHYTHSSYEMVKGIADASRKFVDMPSKIIDIKEGNTSKRAPK
jgi:integrase